MIDIDPDKISALIRDCAARLILPRFNLLQEAEIESKSGPNDLVTVADRETEVELESALPGIVPGSIVIGEEAISAGQKTLGALTQSEGIVWVVDPVDGTWNFVHGKPEFAVMLACVIDGETRHGWIYDVPAGRMMYAGKGQGAWIDGVRQRVAPAKAWRQWIGFCGMRYFPAEQRPMIKSFVSHIKGLHTLGCAGHEYLKVISGAYDFALYNRAKPWDHLAGTLAVAEAGGFIRRFDGEAYRPADETPALIAASNELVYDILQRELIRRLPKVVG